MDLSTYTRALREDLMSAAAVGDDTHRRSAAVLAAAIEPAARLAIMNALADFAAEVTGELRDTTVDVRLDGRDVKIAVSRHGGAEQTAEPSSAPSGPAAEPEDLGRALSEAGGELSRTTVRIFNDLKTQAEQAAAARGESLNAFISRAIAHSVRGGDEGGRSRRTGKRGTSLSGYIQS